MQLSKMHGVGRVNKYFSVLKKIFKNTIIFKLLNFKVLC